MKLINLLHCWGAPIPDPEKGILSSELLKRVYGTIRSDKKLHKYAARIEKARLESMGFYQMGDSENYDISYKEMKNKIKRKISNFRKTKLVEWSCFADSSEGDATCGRSIRSNIKKEKQLFFKERDKLAQFQRKCNLYIQQARAKYN